MSDSFFVIGVGASAGGLEALTELFANLPEILETNTTYIVAQHLSPNYRSMLVQILAKESVFPVVEAENNQALQAGHIYITPPDFDIQVSGGLIALSKPRTLQGPKPSADILFASLAEGYGKNAIGIVLSGTGTDGAQGIERIKGAGGLAIIQNPDTAKYDGMPLASLQTGLVDYSLPPAKIGLKLEELLLHTVSTLPQPANTDLEKLFAMLNHTFGVNFAHYKKNTILRRITKSVEKLGLHNVQEYVQYIEENTAELHNLYLNLLINVTSFFRDTEAHQQLIGIIEKRISQHLIKENLRIWVAGCSSGEEAYSLAMSIQNLLDQYKRYDLSFQIFASDVDDEMLDFARKGQYSIDRTQSIPQEFLDKYWIKTEKGYEIDKNLRSKILFSKHDVTLNPPFLKLDLVSCRNLLIYLNADIQRQVFPVFHYALKEDGLLFLGKSESITQVDDLFDTLDNSNKIFQKRKFSHTNNTLKFNAFKPVGFSHEWRNKKENSTPQDYRGRVFETFANITQHPYLILNPLLDIVETRGDWSDFMQIPEGMLNLNVNKLLRKEILLEIKNIVLLAIKEKKPASSPLKKININNKKYYIKIQCGLIGKDQQDKRDELYLLVLEKHEVEEEDTKNAPQAVLYMDNPRVQELEQELNVTKEHLQTYIEEIETANEELQSLNEELQSANEELQSSNEELETGNEELQSANEELQTAYAEIKYMNLDIMHKEAVLEEANTLFSTLFENTQQGNILLEENLLVRLINREALNLFARIGITQIDSNKNLLPMLTKHMAERLQDLIDQAKATHQLVKETIKIEYAKNSYYYEFCVLPVKPLFKNEITYLTISIYDVSEMHKRELELFRRDELLSSLLHSNSSYLIRTDMEGRYTYANDAFCRKFGFKHEQLIGKYYAPTVHHEDLQVCEKAVRELFANPSEIITFEIRKPNPKGGYFNTEWEFAAIQNQEGQIVEVQGVGKDITPYKNALYTLEEERNQLEMMIWGGRLGTWDWDLHTNKIVFNHRWLEMLGYDATESVWEWADWQNLIHPDDKERVIKTLQDNIIGNTAFYDIEHRKRAKNGEWRWLSLIGKVVERDKKGKAVRVIGIHQDLTDKKRAEEIIKVNDSRNQSIFSAMQEGIVLQDMTGAIISCNQSAEQILGLTYDQMVGRTSIDSHWRAIREDGSPFPIEEHPAMLTIRTGKPQQQVIMGVYKPDDSISWISINSQLLYHPDTKTPYAVFATFYDITQRKQAEKQITWEKQRLHNILEGANVGTWEWNVQTGETIFNSYWAEMLGYTLAELQPISIDTWTRLCHPEDLVLVNERIAQHFEGKLPYYECEARMLHKNGHWIWVLDRGKVHDWTTDGNPLAMSGTHLEITDRKEAETALQASEQRYRQVVETQSDFVLLSEPDTTITFANISLGKALGVLPEQMLGLKWVNFANPEDTADIGQKIQKLSPTQNSFITENRDKRANGEWGWTQWINQGVFDEAGKLIQIQSVGRDVTEIKKVQELLMQRNQALQESEIKLRALSNSTKDGNVLLGKQCEILFFNEATAQNIKQHFGKDMQVGESIWAYTTPDEQDRFKEYFNKALLGEMVVVEQRYTFPNGEVRYFEVKYSPAYDQNNDLIGVSFVTSDITARKEAEDKIRHQNEELSIIEEQLRAGIEALKNTNQKLSKSEYSLNKAQQTAKIGSWEFDLKTFELVWSDEHYRIFELEKMPPDQLYEAYRSKIHPEDLENLDQVVRHAQVFGAGFLYEHRVLCQDGSIKYVLGIGEVVKDEQDKPVLLRGTVQDITERKRADEKLWQATTRLALATRGSGIGIWDYDVVHDLLVWDEQMFSLYGIENKHKFILTYSDWYQCVHPDDATRVSTELDKTIQGEQDFNTEFRILNAQQETRYIQAIAIVQKDSAGKPLRVIGTNWDITERKKAEFAILEEQKRFKDIVNSTEGIVWEVDFNTFLFTFVSQQAEAILGYDLAEWYQPNFWEDHIHPEDQTWAVNFCFIHSQNLQPHDFEYRFFAKDGSVRWLRDIVNVVAEDGKPILLRGIMLDITKQKNAEKLILEAYERLSQLEKYVNHSTDAIQVADEEGNLVYINQTASERLGIPQEEAYLHKVEEFEQRFSQDLEWKQHIEDLKKEDFLMIEGINKHRETGKTFPVEVKVRYVVINGKGYVIASSRDVTERKKMEAELYRLSMVAKRTSNAVIITDENRHIVWVNEAFTQITGYTLQEVIGISPRIFQFEDTNQETLTYVNQKLARCESVRFEVLNKGKTGNPYWLDIEIQPLFDNQHKHTGFMAIQTDITARKEHEQMIKKQNEALREIAFFQSHILRRPVANIIGLCNLIEIAREEKADLSVIHEYLEYLLASVQETDEVIHQIVNKANEIEDEEDLQK